MTLNSSYITEKPKTSQVMTQETCNPGALCMSGGQPSGLEVSSQQRAGLAQPVPVSASTHRLPHSSHSLRLKSWGGTGML